MKSNSCIKYIQGEISGKAKQKEIITIIANFYYINFQNFLFLELIAYSYTTNEVNTNLFSNWISRKTVQDKKKTPLKSDSFSVYRNTWQWLSLTAIHFKHEILIFWKKDRIKQKKSESILNKSTSKNSMC